jgi:hypothetical protein
LASRGCAADLKIPTRLNAVESSDLEAKEIVFLESICGRVDILAPRLK